MGLEHSLPESVVIATRLEDVVNWARKNSLFQYPFVFFTSLSKWVNKTLTIFSLKVY